MDLFDVVRACFRRWYVIVPLALVSTWAAYHAYSSVKPVYYSNTVVGLAPPNAQIQYAQPGVPVPRNGLLDAGGPTLIANLAVLGLRDSSVISHVVAGGGSPNFNVIMFPVPPNTPPVPLITIDTSTSDPDTASKTVSLVAAEADGVLKIVQQQAGVQGDLMVRAISASPPSRPVYGVPSRTRATVSIFLAGILISVVAAVAADSAMTRRAERKGRGLTSTPAQGQAESQTDLPLV